MEKKLSNFIFFGSSDISVATLNHLKAKGFIPSLVVTKPDSPQGRGLEIRPSVVKVWALENNIPIETPEKLKTDEFLDTLKSQNAEFAILVSYGKIIPQTILDMFPKGILNLHPSLLPKLRGPAPIEYTILNDMKDNVGVSIMLLEAGMDTGPVLAQQKIELPSWPIAAHELYNLLSNAGSTLLTNILPSYLEGKIEPKAQDDSLATYSRIIVKKDGELSIDHNDYRNYLKYLAYEGWPGTFFFEEKDGKSMRIKITEASFENNEFKILKVIPEGKKEMDYEIFKKGLKN